MTPVLVLAIVGTVLAGLSAGVFLSFSAGVLSGLDRGSDRSYVEGMRGINRAVINPAFLGPIFLAPIVLIVAGALGLGGTVDTLTAGLLLAAGVLGLLGTVVVTMARNVPLNTRLDASTAPDADIRAFFHRSWLRWNHLRTLTATAALALAVMGLALD